MFLLLLFLLLLLLLQQWGQVQQQESEEQNNEEGTNGESYVNWQQHQLGEQGLILLCLLRPFGIFPLLLLNPQLPLLGLPGLASLG